MTGEKFMREIFDRYRKAIITGGGVILFLIFGMITMIFTDSGNESATQKQQSQNSRTKNESMTTTQNRIGQNQIADSESSQSKPNHPSRTVYIYITGEIAKPGVYKLSEDSRIFQLIEMAGGFTPRADTESLNLAENVIDGSHVHIGSKFQVQYVSPSSPTIPGMPANVQTQNANARANSAVTYSQTQAGKININTASAGELESLPGIGPALAQRIIDYRNNHGNFARPEDLINVRGIGQSKLAQILPHVTAMNTGGSYTTAARTSQPQSTAGLIDINRASQKELERLTGVGPATAKRIIEYRNQHGRFTKPEDLMNIRGIGAAKLNNMRHQILIR